MSAMLRAVGVPCETMEFPREIEIREQVTSMGRSKANCQVCFNSQPKVVSRVHASIIRNAHGGFSIRDEGSLNGTYLNGKQLPAREETLVQHGDIISFGSQGTIGGRLLYRFELGDDEEEGTDVEDCSSEQQAGASGICTKKENNLCDSSTVSLEGLSLSSASTALSNTESRAVTQKSPPSSNSCWLLGSMCSKQQQETSKCMKRARSSCGQQPNSESDSCPFSSLMRIVRSHAKRLCLTGCKGKADEVMAAASAACNAVAQTQQHLSQVKQIQSSCSPRCDESASVCDDASACSGRTGGVPIGSIGRSCSNESMGKSLVSDGEDEDRSQCHFTKSNIPCIPLSDNQEGGGSSCIPLVTADHEHAGEKAVQETIAKTQQSIEDSSSTLLSRRISELRSELTCPICQDSFVNTNTLECGHSFCEPCVNAWLCKCLSCPICRAPVSKPPIRSRTIDKAVEVTLQTNNLAAWQSLQDRRAEYEECQRKDMATKQKLEEALEKAMKKGLKCVHIARHWSEREQNRFLKGLKCYRGAPREAYCSSVALTPCFVQRASLKDLAIAARNVRLKGDCDQMDAVQLRNRLFMFLKYS